MGIQGCIASHDVRKSREGKVKLAEQQRQNEDDGEARESHRKAVSNNTEMVAVEEPLADSLSNISDDSEPVSHIYPLSGCVCTKQQTWKQDS